LDEVAAAVGAIPGVTHSYARRHAINLWFTLTAETQAEIDRTIAALRAKTGIAGFQSLPSLAVYKTQAVFRIGDERPRRPAPPTASSADAVPLSEDQKKLVRLLDGDLPIVPDFFAAPAADAGMSPQELLGQVRDWLAKGVIRRFGAIVAHRKLGYRANGMAVFRTPADRADAAGARLAGHDEVTHCYLRSGMPDWPYNLFAMVHGRSEDAVRACVGRAARDLGVEEFDVLFSDVEFKKQSMRHFLISKTDCGNIG
jgi:DNA-binding Lrp family transcriptional regulator